MLTNHDKYLAFDIGERHTGVAANFGSLVQPLTTLNHTSYNEQLAGITAVINQHRPKLVVLGKPTRGIIKERVEKLTADLKHLHFKVETIDETASTKEAQALMREAGKSATKRAKAEHQVVAAKLLQNYLEQD